jgi:hypothetical protein
MKWSEWLSAADDQGFSALPVGTYDMYVDKCTATQSSSGKDMLKLVLAVEGGPNEGSKVFTNMVISPESPAALGFLIRKLAAFGLDREYLAKNPSLEKIADDLENRRCIAEVTQREFQGTNRNDINTVKPPTDGVVHHASGPVPDSDMGVFGSFSPTPPVAHHHHANPTAPELPF